MHYSSHNHPIIFYIENCGINCITQNRHLAGIDTAFRYQRKVSAIGHRAFQFYFQCSSVFREITVRFQAWSPNSERSYWNNIVIERLRGVKSAVNTCFIEPVSSGAVWRADRKLAFINGGLEKFLSAAGQGLQRRDIQKLPNGPDGANFWEPDFLTVETVNHTFLVFIAFVGCFLESYGVLDTFLSHFWRSSLCVLCYLRWFHLSS